MECALHSDMCAAPAVLNKIDAKCNTAQHEAAAPAPDDNNLDVPLNNRSRSV
jgi:hypothetical protein